MTRLVKFKVIKNTLGDCIYNMSFLTMLYDYMKTVELSEIMIEHYKNAWHYYYYHHLFAFKYRKGSEITGVYIQLSSFP